MARFQEFFNKYIWQTKRDVLKTQDESRVMDIIVDDWAETYGVSKPADIEAYGKVYSAEELVYICVSAIAQASAKAPLMVLKKTIEDGEVVYVKDTNNENPINQLFTRVNQQTTEEAFKEITLTSLELQGNSYWWIVRDSLRIPREMFHLRPDWVTIIPDSNGYVKGYIFENGAQKERFEPEEILHIKYHDPRSYFYGLSPIAAATVTVQASIYAKLFQKSFFINSSRPAGILKTDQPLNPQDIDRIEKMWKQAHSGPKNAFRTAIMSRGLEYQAIGLNQQESDFINQLQNFAERIMGIFKVPPVMGAVYKESHYNNADIQRKIFWEEVLSAKLNMIAGQINEFLVFPIWGEDYRVAFDYSGIEVLQEKEDAIIERYRNAVSGGLMTPNEVRGKMGLEPVDGGDTLYIPFSLSPIGSNTQTDETDNLKSIKKKEFEELADKLAQTRERGINTVRKNYYEALQNMFTHQGNKIAELIEELNDNTKAKDDKVTKIDEERLWEKGGFSKMMEDVSWYFIGACLMLGISSARELSGVEILLDLDSPKIAPVREALLKKIVSLTDRTSKDKLRELIMDAYENNKTVADLTKQIKTEWKQYSTYRAERIARTETSNAYSEGCSKYYQETGATEKKWINVGDSNVSEICLTNSAQGWISIFEPFDSGDEHEPSHVNCRCSVIYK